MMSFENEFGQGDGVIYLNVGNKHLRNLAMSLFSLRKIYDGPVAILSGDEAVDDHIIREPRLGDISVVDFEYKKTKRGSTYFAKTSMHRHSPFERSVFLDCDTIVVGTFTELLPGNCEEILWTQFASWMTSRIKKRIAKWKDILPAQVAYQTANEYPAINTGVIGFSKGSSRMMDVWHETTKKNICFICDEICAQLLAFEYPHQIADHRFNASPRYSVKDLNLADLSNSDARIIHNHGNKGLKTSEAVQANFLSTYFEAYDEDWCGMQAWDDSIPRHPRGYVKRIEDKFDFWRIQRRVPLVSEL